MEAPKSYTIRTETGELRLMSQEEVGALVRSTMEKAKATPPSPSPKSQASATSPRPRNPYTSTSQRLSRTPKRGARKFHFRLSPEAKKSNDQNQAAFVSGSTSNSSKEAEAECRSEKPSSRSPESQRCPSRTDDAVEAHEEEEKPVLEEMTTGSEPEKADSGVKTTKKNLSEVEIGDLVRNSIRRARENSKEKTPQQLSQAQQAAFAINEITTSPVAKQVLSWSSTEEQEAHKEEVLPTNEAADEPSIAMQECESQPINDAGIETPSPAAHSLAISKISSIVEEETPPPMSPTNQPSVASEAQSHFSRAFRSFFHSHFQSHENTEAGSELLNGNELLNKQVTVETKATRGIDVDTPQDFLRVDIPSYSEDVRDEQPSLNRIVQETMRRARETAEESVLECGPLVGSCQDENRADPSTYDINGAWAKDINSNAATPDSFANNVNTADDAGNEEFNETRITEALDISDVDSEIEDLSYQRSMQASYGPFGGCCGVPSVLSSTGQTKPEEMDRAESKECEPNCDGQTDKSFEKNLTQPTSAFEVDNEKCNNYSSDEDAPNPKAPTLEEVVMKLMKSEATGEGEPSEFAPSPQESMNDQPEDEDLPKDEQAGNRPLLKLKVSCSSDEEFPTAREVRKSLSASLHSTSKSMQRTRSVSDFCGAHRRAQTLSSRSRRYRRSIRKSREQSPKAQITEEFLADLAKRKGKKITIDELKRMLNVTDYGSDEERSEADKEHDIVNFNSNQLLQPHVPDTAMISTPFCMDIWDLFQPMDDLRRLSDDECGPPNDSYHSAADLESAVEDTTSIETTTFCDTDAEAQPNPRMTFSFSAREASSSSDDSTIIGW